jgi:hypothetical protein
MQPLADLDMTIITGFLAGSRVRVRVRILNLTGREPAGGKDDPKNPIF